ncbi:TPA: MFS transporter [Staphylococcus pseudintermedius]|uniref:sugar efflux transporter n=1 Tax=Staphylococcus pseudintermedius TaxID=283734 RepID=UPI0018E1449E|nr:sugar efflux transporter [Staphylococcus pseudintermedius]EGQ0316558.1 MFS transporter [Staphylococcus pseudintermedius]EGQ3105948.1 MFS transporter [Staphylococcus pseudintermedius]EJM2463201.1 sugar efflux transporter [Staphylococcus pseudintermedius]EKF8778685.1 sugar efflux transporter [Staphylococcus pseudintermedius]EKO8941220.1 sugar efflux transporter [Staphylococcus pseudintermedius]
MFRELLTIKNYKLFIVNMMLIGMGIAITVPFFVLFATNQLGMTTNQFGLLLALAAITQFTMNSIVARFSDTHAINRKVIIIVGLFMGAISFTLPFFVHSVVLFIILYAIFQGLFAPAMPQLYASARESINQSTSSSRAVFANSVLRSMFSFGFLFGPLVGNILNQSWGYSGLFGGTVAIILTTLLLQVFFFKDIKAKKPVRDSIMTEQDAPSMLKHRYLIVPFIAFVLLHIGQWMYTLNMPLFVTQYLHEEEKYVGHLASLCAGLEVPFMIILGMVASKVETRTLLAIAAVCGSLFFGSIGIFESIHIMLVGQVLLAAFLAVLLGIGISYFQDVLPQYPGYASTLFANAMVIGQLLGNLLGGAMSQWVGLGNVFYVSALSLTCGFVLILFTKKSRKTVQTV